MSANGRNSPNDQSGLWTQEQAAAAAGDLEGKDAVEVCRWMLETFGSEISFAFSGAEDVLVIDLMAKTGLPFRAFTLDTQRLHNETYDLLKRVEDKYDFRLEFQRPDAAKVDEMVRTAGYDCFYDSMENRKLCCGIRKVQPLRAHIATLGAWVTGLRRDQAVTRAEVPKVEIDVQNGGIVKLNPIADWSFEQVWEHIRANDVPYNELHDKGFPSIGCVPCTREIAEGEDIRAGRWWWENPQLRECGLHPGSKAELPADR